MIDAAVNAPAGSASRVRVQAFPLLAELPRLRRFCELHLNRFIPPSVAVFRPALPAVLCCVLHYPEMAGASSWEMGSMTQNELYFLVPLERYREVNGRLEFVEFGATTPYIFVDNPESAAAGRERFGMPKQYGHFSTESLSLPWPIGTQRYLSLAAYEPGLAGRRLQALVDIVRTQTRPFQSEGRDEEFVLPSSRILSPEVLTQLARSLGDMARTTFGATIAGGIADRLRAMVATIQQAGSVALFNFRQFVDPEPGDASCYQDLVSFRMNVREAQSFGFLGRNPLASEFRLMIRKSEIHPIVDRLGLRVNHRLPGSKEDPSPLEIVDVLAPFYAQGDVELRSTERLCWRGLETGWFSDANIPITPPARAKVAHFLGLSGTDSSQLRGEATALDLKYVILPVRRATLATRLAAAVPRGAPIHLEPQGTSDYGVLRVLVYQSRPRQLAEQEELTWMDGIYMSLSTLVTAQVGDETFTALAMLQDFSDNPFQASAVRELTMQPTTYAEFDIGSEAWFSSTRPFSRVVGMSAMAIERSNSMARLVKSPVLDLYSGDFGTDLPLQSMPADQLAELRREVCPRAASILPLISFGRVGVPSDWSRSVLRRALLTFFRDLEVAEGGAGEGREINEHVARLHVNETFPFLEKLGLVQLPGEHAVAQALRDGIVGRTVVSPAIFCRESANRVKLRGFRVLWESYESEPEGGRE